MINFIKKVLLFACCSPLLVFASGGTGGIQLDLTTSYIGVLCVSIFVISYLAVMSEEVIHLKKSKPVVIASGLIWFIIGATYSAQGGSELVGEAIRHNILEFAELMLFLLVAMTYVNAMIERNVFDALRSYLVSKNLSFKKLFWITGIISFFLSPIADNLTTALVMCAVLLAVGNGNKEFILLGCINVVVAANAGGAFSPFGDITTLMVWQKGLVSFSEFFVLVLPSAVNFLVPAAIMQFAVPNVQPKQSEGKVEILRGGIVTIFLFLCTIVTSVSAHSFFELPPAIGMMLGLGYLMIYSYYLRMTAKSRNIYEEKNGFIEMSSIQFEQRKHSFDPFHRIAAAEWDTLLFFFGVILSVGGLGFLGYLTIVSENMYLGWGTTQANIMVGFLSAIVDNIPVMFAVLTMNPEMSLNQWLLVTLTAGVGGSMLSIGSAAGVALMGQSKGQYTFLGHLKWTPVIFLGYVASILTHIAINGLN